MTLPLIVIEDRTALDINDCYFRSIKRDKVVKSPSPKNAKLENQDLVDFNTKPSDSNQDQPNMPDL